MLNYILKRNADGTVDYLMKQKGCNVTGKTQFESALGLLRLAKKDVRASAEFPEYPITADGVYHFKGEYEVMEPPEIGADGLPMPAGAEKPKRKKRDERPTEGRTEGANAAKQDAPETRHRASATVARRLKDIVCE